MRAAIPCENENIFQHFGKTTRFMLYEIENGKVLDSRLISTGGLTGHEAVVQFLSLCKASVVVCGGIGGDARAALLAAGIACYPGVIGRCDDAARSFAEGRLSMNPAGCAHHLGAGCPHHMHDGTACDPDDEACAGCSGCSSPASEQK